MSLNPVDSQPVRILQLNSMLTGGGTDEQCLQLSAHLLKLGHSIWFLGSTGRQLSARALAMGVPLHPYSPRFGMLGFTVSGARLIRREHIQVVHAHHGRDFWPAIIAARLSGVRPKVVLTRHLAKSPSAWISRRSLLSQCDAMIAVSHAVAAILSKGSSEPDSPEPERRWRPPLRGPIGRIKVVYGGIDTSLFRPGDGSAQRRAWGLASGDYAFGMVGGFDLPRGKGQREFLLAASRFAETMPSARFLIVGRGTMRDLLQADITRLGLARQASLTGYCQNMPEAMRALDCLVHPQVGTEALGLVVCEAHACGKPVIASALDGIPEAFSAGNYGQLVPPESIGELALALRRWAGEKPLSLDQQQLLHRRVQESFSIERSAQEVLGLYRQLLDQSRL